MTLLFLYLATHILGRKSSKLVIVCLGTRDLYPGIIAKSLPAIALEGKYVALLGPKILLPMGCVKIG